MGASEENYYPSWCRGQDTALGRAGVLTPAYVVTPRPRRGDGRLSSDGSDRSDGLDRSDEEAPRRGAFCVARVSEGRSPDDPGKADGSLFPSTPLGVGRSRRASGGSDALSGSRLSVTSRETRDLRHCVPQHPCYERGTPPGCSAGRAVLSDESDGQPQYTGSLSTPASVGCPLHRHRSRHEVPTTAV